MCFFDHSFGYNFLFSVFSQIGCLNFEKKDVFSNAAATFTSRREKYIFRGTRSDARFFNGQVPKR